MNTTLVSWNHIFNVNECILFQKIQSILPFIIQNKTVPLLLFVRKAQESLG